MLRRLRIKGLKSLQDVELELPRVAVLAGPNAAGKSNVLDAVQLLARVGTQRTLAEALTAPIRGFPAEAFTLPEGGLPALLEQESANLMLEADLELRPGGARSSGAPDRARYRIAVDIDPDASQVA